MEFKIMITINRHKRDSVKERTKEFGVNPSIVTVYGILRLLDMMDGKRLTAIDRKFVALAVGEYRPYESEADICNTSISFSGSTISRLDLTKQLSDHGFRLVSLCKAFYNVLLKCDISSIPTRSTQDGFVLSRINKENVLNLKNRPLNTPIYISEPIFQKLKEIAEQNGISIYSIIARSIDALISIEFENDVFINNSDIIRDTILLYNRKITSISGSSCYHFHTRNIDKGVRILFLLEKYGIPGMTELFHRIIRFILLSNSGEISLSRIHVNDDSDYNETRMIRNEFRKEVLYAAAR